MAEMWNVYQNYPPVFIELIRFSGKSSFEHSTNCSLSILYFYEKKWPVSLKISPYGLALSYHTRILLLPMVNTWQKSQLGSPGLSALPSLPWSHGFLDPADVAFQNATSTSSDVFCWGGGCGGNLIQCSLATSHLLTLLFLSSHR